MEVTVPGTTSTEKVKRIGAYGAKVHVCDTGSGNDVALGYHADAERIARERFAFYPDQYCSELNRQANYVDTGPELWAQLQGAIDVFVCGIGSGGTISGIGRYLKERHRAVRIIEIEPLHSSYRGLVMDARTDGEFASAIEGVGKGQP
jgi:cystathionine beta-synthase